MNEENLNELKELKRRRNIWISVSAVLTAKNGSSEASCDIRNVDDSTHDIIHVSQRSQVRGAALGERSVMRTL